MSFLWRFGNGNTSTLGSSTVSATYVLPGTYRVSLTASNASGVDSMVRFAYITVFTNPTANFSANPTSGCAPLSVQFTDLSAGVGSGITKWLWDFGDGTSSTAKNPSKTYLTSGSFTVTLIVTDANGCEGRIIKPAYINVTGNHNVTFSAPAPLTGCKTPFSKTFTPVVTPAGTGYTYSWNFGDGNFSTQMSPTHSYTATGTYTVSLTVTSASGCAVTFTRPNYIMLAEGKADFALSSNPACAPALVNFTNSSTPSTGMLYNWSGPFGFNSTQRNPPSQQIFTSGTYTYQLAVSWANGLCTDILSKQVNVIVWPKPNADFHANRTEFCKPPATVNFINLSSDAVSYNWTFEGHGSSTDVNPSRVFNALGKFNVRLIATSSNGCKDTTTANDFVIIESPKFEIKPDIKFSGCAPLTVRAYVDDQSLVPLTNWTWTMGNGQTSNADTATAVYQDTGIYTITVTGKNADSCMETKSAKVYVGTSLNNQPVINNISSCYNDFRSIFSLVPNYTPGPFDTINWVIIKDSTVITVLVGNITTLSDSIVKALNMYGTYDVLLRISNKGCRRQTYMPAAFVVRGPRARFQMIMDSCQYNRFRFTNLSDTIRYTHVKWIFPDNTTDTASKTFSRLFNGPFGPQKFTLIAYDSIWGCSDTSNITRLIGEPPKVGFKLSDSMGCSPFTFTITNQTIFGPPVAFKSFSVTIGDGSSAASLPATFTTSRPGYNKVTLVAEDTLGCRYQLERDSAYFIFRGQSNLSVIPNFGCVPLKVKGLHTGTYDRPIKQILFIWGNGDTTASSADSAEYTYLTAPANQVAGWSARIIAIDTNNCRFTSTSRSVRAYKPIPVNTISVSKRCGVDSVRFTGANDPTLGVQPFSFRWTLGNGVTVNGRNFFRNFSGDTTYTATMYVSDANGCIDSLSKDYTINTKQPVANFDANPKKLNCYKPASVINFNDSSIAGAVGIRSYLWRFGDNTTSVLKNPSKIYSAPGNYPITLEVTDSLSCKSIVTMPNFIVVGGPYGSYNFSPRSGCQPHQVTFNTSSPNAMFYIWDQADGKVDTFTTNTHQYIYTNPGIYYPRLTMVDSSGTCDFGLDAIDSITVYAIPNPAFSQNDTVICKNNIITFTNITPAHALPINIWKWHFGNGDSSSTFGPHQILFKDAGRFTVSLSATDTLGCTNTITKDSLVRVYDDTIPPAAPYILRATVINNTSALMEFNRNNESDLDKYVLLHNFQNGLPNSTTLITNINDTSFLETGINTLQNTYSYQLYAMDVCRNKSDFSEVHTTVELKATGIPNAIRLNWTPYTGWNKIKSYEIWKNDPDKGSVYNKVASVEPNLLTYTDTNITCFKPYNYRIKSVEDGEAGQISWSDTSMAIAQFAALAPSTNNIRATVLNNQFVRVEWLPRTFKLPFKYVIFRGVDESVPVSYKTVSSDETIFNDLDVDVQNHSYTYLTYLLDSCGGYSPVSNMAKTILLKIEMAENDRLKYDPQLYWNAYMDWDSGIDYYKLEFFDDVADGFIEISRNNPTELNFTHKYVNLEQRDYCYKITAYQKGRNEIYSTSNIACVETGPRLYAPNVFTINGDNLNDIYYVGGIFVDLFELKIYNRWGILVFESDDMHKGWDGTFGGKPCPPDVYVYKAKGVGRKGQTKEISGTITLLR